MPALEGEDRRTDRLGSAEMGTAFDVPRAFPAAPTPTPAWRPPSLGRTSDIPGRGGGGDAGFHPLPRRPRVWGEGEVEGGEERGEGRGKEGGSEAQPTPP